MGEVFVNPLKQAQAQAIEALTVLTRAVGHGDSSQTTGFVISWAENPLKTHTILNDLGRLRLRYAIALDAISDAKVLIGLDRRHEPRKTGGLWVDHFEFLDVDIESTIDETATKMERDLSDVHCGDCTCVPCSCVKCYAESLLGHFTTDGLEKHPAHHVEGAFSQGRETLAEAIHYLKTSPITASWKSWDGGEVVLPVHIPRWDDERRQAVDWLIEYGEAHGFATS